MRTRQALKCQTRCGKPRPLDYGTVFLFAGVRVQPVPIKLSQPPSGARYSWGVPTIGSHGFVVMGNLLSEIIQPAGLQSLRCFLSFYEERAKLAGPSW